MPLWPRPCLIVMLVSRFGAVFVRTEEADKLDGAVERVAVVRVVRVDWEVLLRTERADTDRRDEAAEATLEGRGET